MLAWPFAPYERAFLWRRALRARIGADPEATRRDRARLAELQRLEHLDPAIYDRSHLPPERIAEILKCTRTSLVIRGFRNALHNAVPVAVAPRDVHVRAPEPIAVAAEDSPEARRRLLAALRSRLQRGLDDLAQEFAASDRARAIESPLASHSERAPA